MDQLEIIDKDKEIYLQRKLLTPDMCKELIAFFSNIANNPENVIRDFDEYNLSARVLWNDKKSGTIPVPARATLQLLEDVTMDRTYLPENLRSIQFNTQSARAVQELHTDFPFTKTAVFHLSPDGQFAFRDTSGTLRYVYTGQGDVLRMNQAHQTRHCGSNPSHLTRYTLAFFFS